MITSALVLPTPRALLGPVSAIDPVADLRKTATEALAELPAGELAVVAAPVSAANAARGITEPLGHRVARHLLGAASFRAHVAGPHTAAELLRSTEPTVLLVMADGSARRHEKAPGHAHPESLAFDDRVEAGLRTGDAEALVGLDPELGAQLWCECVPCLHVLGEVALGRRVTAQLRYAEAPYGVAWWVARWDLDPQ